MIFFRSFALSTLFIIACSILGLPLSVNAQQIDLAISPSALVVLVKPDTQVLIPYTVTNRADSIGIRPLIKTYSVEKQGESVVYGSVEKLPIKTSFVDESSEKVDAFTLNKGTTKKIFLLMEVPSNASEGDYHLSFIAETQPEFLDKQYSAKIKSRIASPLLVTVTKTGKTQVKGAITVFEIAGNIFDSFDPIPMTLRVKNQGKNAVNVDGTLTIRGSFGEKATYTLQNRNVLANSEKLMTTKLKEGGSTATLKGFFMGRYGVSASVVLADGTVQINKSTSFFAFPFKIISFAVLGAFVGIMILRKKR